MKIALASDWHIGITKPKAIKNQIKAMKNDNPDVIVIAGDFCGGIVGSKSVNTILKMFREEYTDLPILFVLGNHDYWADPRRISRNDLYQNHNAPTIESHTWNYEKILEARTNNNAHFLDVDGIFRHKDFPGVAIAGHSLWYKFNPPSNDLNFMPRFLEGDTHKCLYKISYDKAQETVDGFIESDTIRIFVSHFPIIDIEEKDEIWSGDRFFGEMLKESYSVTHFFHGHDHKYHNGPRYSPGSDYEKPKYMIIEV